MGLALAIALVCAVGYAAMACAKRVG